MTDIAQIVSGLSDELARSLVLGNWNVAHFANQLIALGLVRWVDGASGVLNIELTPLGLTVRERLQSTAHVRGEDGL